MENGRKAKEVWWFRVDGDIYKIPKEGEEFIYHSEYFGDHAENWILVKEGGKETQRLSTARVDGIVWLEEETDETTK